MLKHVMAFCLLAIAACSSAPDHSGDGGGGGGGGSDLGGGGTPDFGGAHAFPNCTAGVMVGPVSLAGTALVNHPVLAVSGGTVALAWAQAGKSNQFTDDHVVRLKLDGATLIAQGSAQGVDDFGDMMIGDPAVAGYAGGFVYSVGTYRDELSGFVEGECAIYAEDAMGKLTTVSAVGQWCFPALASASTTLGVADITNKTDGSGSQIASFWTPLPSGGDVMPISPTIADGAQKMSHLALGADPSGAFLLVYDWDASSAQLYASHVTSSGVVDVRDTAIGSTGGAVLDVTPQVMWNGAGWGVAWTDTTGVHLRQLDASGLPLAPDALVATGTAAVAWNGVEYGVLASDRTSVQLTLRDTTGASIGSPLPISAATEADVALAALADGTFVAAWTNVNADGFGKHATFAARICPAH